ncbi:MAG TPA: glycosyltransferase [Bacteroidales bacterium]|nr:glycosyltransferase [Bacteroidales bacterium]
MISVIICTSDPNKIIDIEKNISNTIGVAYELIIIDNSKLEYNIFQAYNIGVKRSRYQILCFMHDDIVYHSNNWGFEVMKHFDHPETGMIGVSGTRFLSSIPTVWWAGWHKLNNSNSGILCQNSINTNRNNINESNHILINPENSVSSKVVIIDGLWFSIRKTLFEKIEFDDKNYKGFHFYDLDISMQIYKLKFNNLCVFNILIEHISASNHDLEWVENCNIFYHKWKRYLPLSITRLSFKQLLTVEYFAIKIFRNIHKANNIKFLFVKFSRSISISNLIIYHLKALIR